MPKKVLMVVKLTINEFEAEEIKIHSVQELKERL